MNSPLWPVLFTLSLVAAPALPLQPVIAAESASTAEPPPADAVKFDGLSADRAAAEATLPSGFRMHVFAAEPNVVQPIAFCLDHRGRVWVAEGLTYPKRAPEGQGRDRILVLEDTDGDHRFDKQTVFMEKVNLISGLEIGFGGVWIGAAPTLSFVPVADWDNPKPAGEPRVLLDGWNYTADTHETLNTFTWGPDGWLYGCHGVFCPSHVGKPGAKESERQWVDAAAWRYHPTKHQFEIFTEGGSNPWGIDFDEHGQLWSEMCVIPHLWHMIQGARIERQGGQHYAVDRAETARNEAFREKGSRKPVFPFIYEDIKFHADHVHWTGNLGPHAANARSDAAGGGHAHAGLMVYLGSSWPQEYRGRLIIGNIHGQRFNADIAERRGSGFVGRHGPDFLNFNDTWSQTLNQLYDQDGSMYVIDWYDKNQCHHNREDGHDRGNGRIYKVVYNNQPVSRIDLAKLSDEELVKLVPSKNEFMSRHARRVLAERVASAASQESVGDVPAGLAHYARHRAAADKIAALENLAGIVNSSNSTVERLRALWALHTTGGLRIEDAGRGVRDPDEWVRAWTLRLFFENSAIIFSGDERLSEIADGSVATLERLARDDASPLVRMHVASALQRIPVDRRWQAVGALLTHAGDAGDHNLPLMYWFAAEACAATDPVRAAAWLGTAKIPKLREFISRRIVTAAIEAFAPAGSGTAGLSSDQAEQRAERIAEQIGQILRSATETQLQLDILRGASAALASAGVQSVPSPDDWSQIEAALGQSQNPEVRILTWSIGMVLGSSDAPNALKAAVLDQKLPVALRQRSLDSLLAARLSGIASLLRSLLDSPPMRGRALRALAAQEDSDTPPAILAIYPKLSTNEKRDALGTLVSRVPYARQLLAAIDQGSMPREVLSADVLRQLRGFKNAEVDAQLLKVYGAVRESSADKQREISRYRQIYRAGGSQPGDAARGRVVYDRACAQCHVLFDAGGKVGPELTGANRTDLDYLLQNILDPNAVIPNDYRATNIETKDGRGLNGIVKQQDARTVTLAMQTETLVLPRGDIKSLQLSELSMMPEGLIAQLTDQEVRDLIYYLGRPGQVENRK